jgi:hypothetical protein
MRVLTKRELPTPMRAVISKMQHSRLYCHGTRRWLDCGFEAGCTAPTFHALVRRGLIRPLGRRRRFCPAHRNVVEYVLTAKGARWANAAWAPGNKP